jgi:hypothetical protein
MPVNKCITICTPSIYGCIACNPFTVLVSWWMGEAILLIELAMEMVNKEKKEGKEDEEDEEDKRSTIQYH